MSIIKGIKISQVCSHPVQHSIPNQSMFCSIQGGNASGCKGLYVEVSFRPAGSQTE